MPKPLFPLGQILATPGALDLDVNFYPYLRRHQCGDCDVVHRKAIWGMKTKPRTTSRSRTA